MPALCERIQKDRCDPPQVAALAEAHDMYVMVDPVKRMICDLG